MASGVGASRAEFDTPAEGVCQARADWPPTYVDGGQRRTPTELFRPFAEAGKRPVDIDERTTMGIIAFIVLGLLAGMIAKAILPAPTLAG